MDDGTIRRLSARLERGMGAPSWGSLSRLWASAVRLARPLRIPRGVRVLCVGGATLGGSGKTPLAIACTSRLLALGVRASYVGHGYRASVRHARFVSTRDEVEVVGDEALEAATRLGDGRVVVGPSRQDAVNFAAAHADVLVLDGPLQLDPARAHLSLLAVDREAPLGSGLCPPRGDLRAPWSALRAYADLVVSVGDALAPLDRGPFGDALEVRVVPQPLDALRAMRVGLATSTARPERFLRMLTRRGIEPVQLVHLADHGRLRLPRTSALDCWVIPGKCAGSLRGRDDVVLLEYHIDLPAALELQLGLRFGCGVSDAPRTVIPFTALGSRSGADLPR